MKLLLSKDELYSEPTRRNLTAMEAWRELFFDILEKRYKSLRSKNPRFSQRAYARMAKISSAAMSNLLQGKTSWKLKPERALIICSSIGATAQQINKLAALSYQRVEYSPRAMAASEYEILTNADHLTVLLSFELKQPRSIGQLASSLNVPAAQVERIIETLLKKGLLVKDTDGKIEASSSEHWMTSDDIPNEIINQHHIANLRAILRATAELPTEVRDTTSMTFVGSLEQMALVKREIREFHQRVHAIMDQSPNNNEVFKLVIGIAPMTLGSTSSQEP